MALFVSPVSVREKMDTWNNRIDEARKKREIQGQRKYGFIHPLSDPRCFVREAREELLDGLNYLQWSMEKGEMTFCAWVEVSDLIEMALGALRGQNNPSFPGVKGRERGFKAL
jgi:hypothetical protein